MYSFSKYLNDWYVEDTEWFLSVIGDKRQMSYGTYLSLRSRKSNKGGNTCNRNNSISK